MKQQRLVSNFSEFENDSHISRKKKAAAKQLHVKNRKDILDLIDVEDDEEDVSMYARYIK